MRFSLELVEVSEADFVFFGHLCGSDIVKCSMRAVYITGMDTNPNDAARKVGHDDEYPVTL